jgi:hypothetical protein
MIHEDAPDTLRRDSVRHVLSYQLLASSRWVFFLAGLAGPQGCLQWGHYPFILLTKQFEKGSGQQGGVLLCALVHTNPVRTPVRDVQFPAPSTASCFGMVKAAAAAAHFPW